MSAEPELKFPCKFPIKVIGKAGTRVEATALSIIKKNCPTFEGNFDRRQSRDGRYLALTFTVNATSKAQLDAIYQSISI